MTGLLPLLLTSRYGEPEVMSSDDLVEHHWNTSDRRLHCVLYIGIDWTSQPHSLRDAYGTLYGDCCGGFIIGDSLKMASLCRRKIPGLYRIPDLLNQPEVRDALSIEPDIRFFMDASNIWFYGQMNGRLYVYDGETRELDDLGDLRDGLDEVIGEWEETVAG